MTFCTTRAVRRGAVVTGLLSALCGALGTSPASAVPVSITLNYTCSFPLLKPEPLSLKISSDIPANVAVGESTPAFKINAVAAVSAGAAYGLRAVDTASIEGTAPADAAVTFPSGLRLPIQVPTVIPKTSVPATGGFDTAATGETPPLAFPDAGNVVISVGDVLLKLTPRLADGQLTGLDSFETECKQVPGQNTTLATIAVGNTEQIVKYGYSLAGTATIKTLTRGSVPLSGSINASLALQAGTFTGDLALNPATANLTALGFLPVVAKLAFVPSGPTTGTLKNGALVANSKIRIKLPQVTLFGLSLGGGSTCQTKNLSNIPLRSSLFFNPVEGGLLSGTFTISDLTGCGALTGILSPLTAGSSNAIALKLTPKPTA